MTGRNLIVKQLDVPTRAFDEATIAAKCGVGAYVQCRACGAEGRGIDMAVPSVECEGTWYCRKCGNEVLE